MGVMSFRHPLQQTYTADYSFAKRQPSNASSTASSIYTNSSAAFALSRTSTLSSTASSSYQYPGHKRGISELTGMLSSTTLDASRSPPGKHEQSPDASYKSVRQSLRPLPQPPADTTPSPPAKTSNRHTRGHSLDIAKSVFSDGSPPSPPSRSSLVRPNSMILSRADAVSRGSPTSLRGQSPVHLHPHTPLTAPDLQSLEKSSTSHLRTLSKFAQNASPDEFAITTPSQEVVGLHGRRRLQRLDKPNGSGPKALGDTSYGWGGRNWMDKQRQFLQAYEYLCHIGEAKEWIEDIIHKPLPPIVQLEEALRDGVTLAEIVETLRPERRIRIFRSPKLQYRHSDNINIFFRFLEEAKLPDLFRFELIDLYDKKNIPKVIYCIHALSWLLFRQGVLDFRIGNLVGQLQFEDHELEAMQKGLDKNGVSMPSFGNMGAAFGIEPEPEPEPEPVESEQDRIDRELHENELAIIDLQSQIRGAGVRMNLGDKMQNLWDVEDVLVDLQSRIRGDQARQIAEYHMTMRRFATEIQSAARGFLFRKRQQSTEIFWKNREADVLELQNLIRAKKARDEVRLVRSQLQTEDAATREVQATIRGFLARRQNNAQWKESRDMAGPVKDLQAAIRGMLLRKNASEMYDDLAQQTSSIVALQAIARAVLVRDQVSRQTESLQTSDGVWRALQAVSRGNLVRKSVEATQQALYLHTDNLSELQGLIRAAAVRREIASTLSLLEAEEPSIVQTQAALRGMLHRQKLSKDMQALYTEIEAIVDLQSSIRGLLFRKKHAAFLQSLQTTVPSLTALQGLARATLLRSDISLLLSELESEEPFIVAVQTAARASLVRAQFAEKQKFFRANMQKVVKIQSFVRGKLQGEAYKSLTTGKNPPVNAVKNFVHLLNDSDFDFHEEIEFERMRKSVVQQIRQNELAEEYIGQLDIKIALLVKNKITLDDVMQHQKSFGGHAGNIFTSNSLSAANPFDLKGLNRNSRKKLESYQQLFFTLQTQPQYLARLFKKVREQGKSESDCKRIETLMMGLFGYAQKRREEYYLLKLIARSIKEEVDGCNSIQDYIRKNFFWSKLMSNYIRSPRDRKFLRELLGPIIRDNIIEDLALDLESDPMQIYRSAISNEELRTGQPSRRPRDVPREVAIKDKETRDMFIDHLRDLREISDQFLLAMEDLLHRMPYGIRFIAQQIFESLAEHFPAEPQEDLLQIVGHWVWRFYLQPALIGPQDVGVIEKQLTPLQKRNLGEVGKVLNQIAMGKLFGGENIYLQPLNAYVGEAIERITMIFSNLISVPDAEDTFDIDEFNDLYAKTKPTLYIKMTDIFAIHNMVASDLALICPSRDDMLREIVHELGSAKANQSELHGVSSGEIQLTLNPKLHDIEDPEAEVKTLFMETKRCVLYIIRVQSGPNLMDILVRPITWEDDQKWHALLKEEFKPGSTSRGAYSDANSQIDITAMPYAELKRTALENIMQLEKFGRISRHNYYQDLLNAIALDIRTKSRRRIQRQRELEGVRMTLSNLHEKARWLEQQRKSYDNYIEQAMLTLQNKKGKKRFLLPFTKQYNHERELERSGRRPKFGSYKYSARTLADKGVLVSWQGYSDRQWDKINITLSCDEVGVFSIEGSMGSIQIPGASAQIPLEAILEAQFAASTYMNVFEGQLRLNVNLFLHLIYKKFYRTD